MHRKFVLSWYSFEVMSTYLHVPYMQSEFELKRSLCWPIVHNQIVDIRFISPVDIWKYRPYHVNHDQSRTMTLHVALIFHKTVWYRTLAFSRAGDCLYSCPISMQAYLCHRELQQLSNFCSIVRFRKIFVTGNFFILFGSFVHKCL